MIGRYRDEFPDFGELDVALPDHFEDVSWGNEASPCFHSPAARVFLYVDYADPAKREFPELGRFGLLEASQDGQHRPDEGGEILHTDDFSRILETVEARRAEFAAAPRP